MKTEDIAKVVHEANKAYCETMNDKSQVPWEEADKEIQQSAINGVEFRKANPDIQPWEMHENWMKEKVANGWEHGDEKNAFRKTHPCIMDFDDLPEAQKLKDKLFSAVVDTLLNG